MVALALQCATQRKPNSIPVAGILKKQLQFFNPYIQLGRARGIPLVQAGRMQPRAGLSAHTPPQGQRTNPQRGIRYYPSRKVQAAFGSARPTNKICIFAGTTYHS